MWNKFRMLWNLCGVPQSIAEFRIDSAKIPHAPAEFRICYAEFRMCDAEIWGTGGDIKGKFSKKYSKFFFSETVRRMNLKIGILALDIALYKSYDFYSG